MQLDSMPLLRVSLLTAVLALVVPAFAADDVTVTAKTPLTAAPSATVDKSLTIGSANIRVKLVGGTAYLAVVKGAVDLTYADGTPMATVPEGSGLKIDGFLLPGSAVTANLVGGKATLSLGAAVSLNLQSNAKGSALKIMQDDSIAAVLEPGNTMRVNAPVIAFTAGQSVSLKENQVGRAVAGADEVLMIGTANGLIVTTKNASASLKGSGTDQLVLAKDAVLTIQDGALSVSATAISLTGAKLRLVNTAGNIQIVRNGKSTPLPAGQTIGGPAKPSTPVADAGDVQVGPGDEEVDEIEATEPTDAEAEVLEEMEAWNEGQ